MLWIDSRSNTKKSCWRSSLYIFTHPFLLFFCFYKFLLLVTPQHIQLLGDVAEAVRHARAIRNQIRHAQSLDTAELFTFAKELRVPFDLLQKTAEMGRLPVVNFAAGGLGRCQFTKS